VYISVQTVDFDARRHAH